MKEEKFCEKCFFLWVFTYMTWHHTSYLAVICRVSLVLMGHTFNEGNITWAVQAPGLSRQVFYYSVYEFSVPQIEYPLGGSSKKGSHVYFLLHVFWVILLFCQKCCSDATMVIWCHNSTIWCHYSSTMSTITRKYTWLPFVLLSPSGYSIWGTENW